jgi:succinate dehydrogenase / fumarate reductase membrane anchor subunit
MSLRTPLGRVRGLGTAREGVHHWVALRVTSVALVPLTIWFLWAATSTFALGYADARSFVAQPWNAVLMAAFVVCAFHHAHLGMQVVIEDYVHTRWVEISLLVLVKFVCWLAAAAGVLAIVRIALGS